MTSGNIFARTSSFSNHPSIQMIKDKHQNSFNFKFEPVTTDQVIKFIDEIDCKKTSSGYMSAKIIKVAKKEIAEPIRNCINSSILIDTFPDELKIADTWKIKIIKLIIDQSDCGFCK